MAQTFQDKMDCVHEQSYLTLTIEATLIPELIFVLKKISQHFDSPFDTLQFLNLRSQNKTFESAAGSCT